MVHGCVLGSGGGYQRALEIGEKKGNKAKNYTVEFGILRRE